jgi:hypothetical protein
MRFASFAFALALPLAACSPSNSPQTGSQTNWLVTCDSSAECGTGLECVCGACTATCLTEPACADLPGASCVASSDDGAIALCGGKAPPINLCLPRCDDESCADGMSCVAGVCQPTGKTSLEVTVDPTARYQTLVGFGASLAYAEDQIDAHPDKAALYDAFFTEAGLDVLRLRNRYDDGTEDPLSSTSAIVDDVSERLGHAPVLFLNSPTPPAALKANGSRTCDGDPATCTLVSLPSGGFDYAGFAGYWRSSLEAYAGANLRPDFISIQSHPNWIAPDGVALDACIFLPEEGTTTVTVDDVETEVTYPGYREALAEVERAIADLPDLPLIGAPETGVGGLAEFVSALDVSSFDALAFHGYGVEPASVDPELLEDVGELAEQSDRPAFLTEMQSEGIETAVMIHHALTAANASVYLQNDLVLTNPDAEPLALALLSEDSFELQGNFYAFSHYAKNTDPGWIRVGVSSSSPDLLSSAWLARDQSAVTVVLVNPGEDALDAKLTLPEPLRSELTIAQVTRTVFDGLERSAALGELPASGVVAIPAGSIVTVSFGSE